MLKNRDGYLVPCDWEDALSVVAERVCSFILPFSNECSISRLVERDRAQKWLHSLDDFPMQKVLLL